MVCKAPSIDKHSNVVITPGETDDATLARLARGGSAGAFGELVHRHHERVFAFLLALTRHRQDAEDLTQETFVRAWERIHRYDPALPMLPWLMVIARRQSIAALRRIRRPIDTPPPLPENPGPSDRALRLWETASRILPEASYAALWLHYRDELPLKQVAAILGKREGAVKVLLHRARRALAAHLNPASAANPPPLPSSPFQSNIASP